MKNQPIQEYIPQAGDKLWYFVKLVSFGGLFLSLSATFFMWAGTEYLHTSPLVWKVSFVLNFVFFIATWITYFPFRKTDRLIGGGLLLMFFLLSTFWMFGISGFYFYFLFAPINKWFRTVVLFGVTAALIYRGWVIFHDIEQVIASKKNCFHVCILMKVIHLVSMARLLEFWRNRDQIGIHLKHGMFGL